MKAILLLVIFGLVSAQVIEPRGMYFLTYRIVASTSPSRIEAHAGLFRSLMKGIFDPYVP